MKLNQLNALSPVDGRYFKTTFELAKYFSEGALMKYRVKVEIEYFIALCKLPLKQLKTVDPSIFGPLRKIYEDFIDSDCKMIKSIEAKTNHDVKSVEYFIKDRFRAIGIDYYKEFIHFGLTSQDINNTAIPLATKDACKELIFPNFNKIVMILKNRANKWSKIPMLSRTHGQPASPTVLGKEIYVFVDRMEQQLDLIKTIPFSAKLGGAVGNFNAHHVAYPKINWIKFSNNFVNNTLKLHRSRVTSQIDHYDCLSALFDNIKRLNTILLDFCRDMWTYISMGYFEQKIRETEVGSSTMPHKINPIDFENAEGNLGIANAIFEHLSSKLPVSRLQRDLTDSTVIRNIGVPMGHTLIAIKSIERGMNKLTVDEDTIIHDLRNNWAVISEGIQTILRREKYHKPYEKIMLLIRNQKKITRQILVDFIETLDVPRHIKNELLNITPETYIGIYDF